METASNGKTIPANAIELFRLYALDAGNWNGHPLVGGNVTLLSDRADRGLLSHLKTAGLVYTDRDDEGTWLSFTADGIAFALSLDIDLTEFSV